MFQLEERGRAAVLATQGTGGEAGNGGNGWRRGRARRFKPATLTAAAAAGVPGQRLLRL